MIFRVSNRASTVANQEVASLLHNSLRPKATLPIATLGASCSSWSDILGVRLDAENLANVQFRVINVVFLKDGYTTKLIQHNLYKPTKT